MRQLTKTIQCTADRSCLSSFNGLLFLILLSMVVSCSEMNSTDPDELDDVQWSGESSSSLVFSSSVDDLISSSEEFISSSAGTSSSTPTSSADDLSSSEQGVSSAVSSSFTDPDRCATSGNCGTFTDSRDAQVYNWTRIGLQVWMAENLNYETSDSSMCYGEEPTNCELYGRLYLWGKAMAGHDTSSSNPSNVQGICPNGWHLPSLPEWVELFNFVSNDQGAGENINGSDWIEVGRFLKADTLWSTNPGSDDYSFSVLPSGWYQGTEGPEYKNEYINTAFFTSSQEAGRAPAKVTFRDVASYISSTYPEGVVSFGSLAEYEDAFSVRCLKD